MKIYAGLPIQTGSFNTRKIGLNSACVHEQGGPHKGDILYQLNHLTYVGFIFSPCVDKNHHNGNINFYAIKVASLCPKGRKLLEIFFREGAINHL